MNSKLIRTATAIPSYQADTGFTGARKRVRADSGNRADHVDSVERRSFLGLITGLIGAGISGFLGITLGRFGIAPALSAARAPEWIDVAPLEEIPEGKPSNRSVVVSQNAGWGHFSSEQSVWVMKQGERLTVFSSICPHLGCTINETAKGFGCVCHNSAWNGAGEKLSGPAPRGMDALEHRVENGVLKVRYQNFKQGAAEKQAAS